MDNADKPMYMETFEIITIGDNDRAIINPIKINSYKSMTDYIDLCVLKEREVYVLTNQIADGKVYLRTKTSARKRCDVLITWYQIMFQFDGNSCAVDIDGIENRKLEAWFQANK